MKSLSLQEEKNPQILVKTNKQTKNTKKIVRGNHHSTESKLSYDIA